MNLNPFKCRSCNLLSWRIFILQIMAKRTGEELVTGLPDFNKVKQEGITLFENYYAGAMGALQIGPQESPAEYAERCYALAQTMIDVYNNHQN